MITLPEKNYKALIFDCDGTLADSMLVHYRSWCKSFEMNGAKFQFDLDLFHAMGGITLIETVKILNEKYNDTLNPEKVVADKDRLFMEEIHHTTPKEDVIAVAKKYHGICPLAVASGNSRLAVVKTLELLKIEKLFDYILTQEDVIKGKPAPDLFLLAAKKMKAAPEDCLVFEDSVPGITAAKAAGMDFVRVV